MAIVLLEIAGLLIALAGAIMLVLVFLRIIRGFGVTGRQTARAAGRRALMDAMRGETGAGPRLLPLLHRPVLMAEILLDITALVRGNDRNQMLAVLTQSGAFAAMARAAGRRGKGRKLCLEAVALFPRDHAEPVLRALLSDRLPSVRLSAALGLVMVEAPLGVLEVLRLTKGIAGASGPVGQLVRHAVIHDPAEGRRYLSHPELSVGLKSVILDGLGLAGDYAALPALLTHQEHADPILRAASVLALGRLMHPQGLEPIGRALDDSNWCVRAVAAKAAGLASFDRLAVPLGRRLSDPIWSVRYQAAEALKGLGEAGVKVLRDAAEQVVDPVLRNLARGALDEAKAV